MLFPKTYEIVNFPFFVPFNNMGFILLWNKL